MPLKTGDLVFSVGRGLTSAVIQLGSLSLPGRGFSHVMIVGTHHNLPILYESTSFPRPPCARTGRLVRGVQAHYPEDILSDPKVKYYHVPLRRRLYRHEADRLQAYLDDSLGRDYDYIGAFKSGGFLFKYLNSFLFEENNHSLFCSELCAEALVHIGVWNQRHISRWSPNALYRRLYFEGVVNKAKRIPCFDCPQF